MKLMHGGMQHYVPRLQSAQEKKLDNDMEEAIVTNATAEAEAEDEGASGRRSAFHHRKEGKEDSVDAAAACRLHAADDHRMIGSK